MDVETVSFAIISLVLLASGIASSMVKRTFHSVMFLGVFLVSVAALYVLLGSPLVGVIQVLVYVGGILTLFVFAVMFVAGDETETTEAAPALQPRSSAWSAVAAVLIAAAALYVMAMYMMSANHAAAGLLGGHSETKGKTEVWVASTLAASVGFLAGLVFLVVVAVAALLAWLGVRHTIDRWSGSRIFGTALAGLVLGLLLALVARSGAWSGAAATDANQTQANDLDRVMDALFGAQAIPLEVLGILLTAVMIGALVLARPMQAPPDAERYAQVTRDQLRESQMASDVALHAEVGK
ncbi:MAG: NADH-quinone oxidoreductase subunit J [Thermoplasmatota archaeon]